MASDAKNPSRLRLAAGEGEPARAAHAARRTTLGNRLVGALFQPLDISSLIYFRIGFGLIMAWWTWDYLASGRMSNLCIEPKFHFTYYGLDWIRPWPSGGMYLHFAAMLLAALCIAAGLCYRAASVTVALGFTWFFLIDRTFYQNHYYLLALISWMMCIVPAHRNFSLDVFNGLTVRATDLPAWSLGLVRFHLALPYFFGGIAKIDADWLAGEPMRQVLALHAASSSVGHWLAEEWVVQFFKWGGLIFDMAVVPLLYWRRTRLPAFVLAVGFHLLNSQLFNIHVFPWFMIFATPMFFDPAWPRRVLRLPPSRPAARASAGWPDLSRTNRVCLGLLAAYCLFQVLWPLRSFVYEGNAGWTERGHYFAWRMMLRGKTSGLRYYITDPESGTTLNPDIREFISDEQSARFARDPEMILHLAHFLADRCRRHSGRRAQVRALVLTSLNGRKPELLIEPTVDLAAEPRGFRRRDWVRPQTEPLRADPWRVPLHQWERHVDIPRFQVAAVGAGDTRGRTSP
ncbi:MAG: HTTM domain-containing protein [Planctomycetaceae bacterium]